VSLKQIPHVFFNKGKPVADVSRVMRGKFSLAVDAVFTANLESTY
jgi:hypothetical protein